MPSAPDQAGRQCQYPQSHPTAQPIRDVLAAVARNKDLCSSIYLDTVQSQSSGGENHHQGWPGHISSRTDRSISS